MHPRTRGCTIVVPGAGTVDGDETEVIAAFFVLAASDADDSLDEDEPPHAANSAPAANKMPATVRTRRSPPI